MLSCMSNFQRRSICMNVKLFMISLSFKAYARIDPCELEFEMGLNSWKYVISFKEFVEWGEYKVAEVTDEENIFV